MKSLETWLGKYAEDHRHPHNQVIHKIAVPLIFFSIVGALHLIPFEIAGSPIGDWITGLVVLSYLRWGFKAFLIMALQWIIALALTMTLEYVFAHGPFDPATAVPRTFGGLLGIFIVAWIGQFAGHSIEGRRPSFLTDLQYLLIGPLWIWLGH